MEKLLSDPLMRSCVTRAGVPAMAAIESVKARQIYDSRVFNHGAGWAPYSAATDPHCKKWVKQHRAAHPETAHTLAVQRERPLVGAALDAVPRAASAAEKVITCYVKIGVRIALTSPLARRTQRKAE